MAYRCRFCEKDASTVYEVIFRRTKIKMVLGVCGEHKKALEENKVYMCRGCGEVTIIGTHNCQGRPK